jgi:hypothetical protein
MTGIEGEDSIQAVHRRTWYCVTVMNVGLEVLTAVAMNVTVCWSTAPNQLLHYGLLLSWFSSLEMEVIRCSETSVHIRTALFHISEDGNIRGNEPSRSLKISRIISKRRLFGMNCLPLPEEGYRHMKLHGVITQEISMSVRYSDHANPSFAASSNALLTKMWTCKQWRNS